MSGYNHITLVGNLVDNPDNTVTSTDKLIAKFTLAVNRDKENCDFVRCVAWEKLANVIVDNLEKGAKVLVAGRLSIRKYEDKEGKKREAAEVIVNTVTFLSPKKQATEYDEEENPF